MSLARNAIQGIPSQTNFASDHAGSVSVADNTRTPFTGFEAPPSWTGENPYALQSQTHLHPPQYYAAQSPEVILSFVTGQIGKELWNSWYTNVALPISYINGNRIALSTIHFNETMPGIAAYETVPRIIERKRDSTTHTTIRRSIGMKVGHDFLMLLAGQQEYLQILKHMATIMHDATCYDVLHAINTCKDHAHEQDIRRQFFNNKTIEEVKTRDIQNWCILQKGNHGWIKMNAAITTRCGDNGITDLNTMIIPLEVQTFVRFGPASSTDFFIGGDRAVQNVKSFKDYDNVDSFLSDPTFKIYITRKFSTEEGDMINPMIRTRQIGEHFLMDDRNADCAIPYKTCHRDIKIYDEDDDAVTLFSLKKVINNAAFVFTNEGKINTSFGPFVKAEDKNLAKENFLWKQKKQFNTEVDDHDAISCMGEMKANHLHPKRYFKWVDSFFNLAKNDIGKSSEEMHRIFNEGLQAIKTHNQQINLALFATGCQLLASKIANNDN